MSTPYDVIGRGYAAIRREDPRLAAAIRRALGDARTVVNVGAGAGSYEPSDREVTAIEPSAVMIAQRPSGSAPAVQASAEELPFADGAFDAAMAVITIHHWEDVAAGVAEMARVARERVVIVTFDPEPKRQLWIVEDYLPEAVEHNIATLPRIQELTDLLPRAQVEALPIPRDCTDRMFATLWGRPEEYLDESVRAATSVWHRISAEAAERALRELRGDLVSGRWDAQHGHLRRLAELDVGLRLVRAEFS